VRFKISDSPLDPAEAVEAVRSPSSGAIATFLGTARDRAEGKKVLRLEYEVQESMALRQFRKIEERLRAGHGVASVAIHHRRGIVEPGGVSVAIAVAAERRRPALAACAEAIEILKKEAPIWKKEVFEDGHRWVQGS
jgi:molybdopterin synthase catalytic subunit